MTEPWVEPLLRIRSDGRLEVVDEQDAAEKYGCLDGLECVLLNGHDGICTTVREDWEGPDPTFEYPHQFAGDVRS
jgi:hypothetical protein